MFNIVLVEPQIPQNTGNIARTCAATGAALHIIKPMGFQVDDVKLKRAGLDYWHMLNIKYYDSFESFLLQNSGEHFLFTTKAKRSYTDVVYKSGAYLIFGREDKGLPEELLRENEAGCVRLPMRGGARSLNLSNTVAIAAYEYLRQNNFEDLVQAGELTKYKWGE